MKDVNARTGKIKLPDFQAEFLGEIVETGKCVKKTHFSLVSFLLTSRYFS